ncbi:ABC transporter G family member 17 [Selaginella moellendorffii]|uniref:ABC transporter G family member 17 n=1 Tax=Selaginella moellendorffii TaxID=88036 RepID=UPI000D1CE02D|nr:ABC transporter G family member 17 [Selaginella moellendorffii]|eukprot:XP_024534754.1 ABC transporter G family member 17 [Selaginella moellendorffii]
MHLEAAGGGETPRRSELQTLHSLMSIDNQLSIGHFKQVPLREKGTGLEFEDITYTVVKKQKSKGGGRITRQVDLLQHITGYAPKGHITAVMGPSGAGKSTFLDALAGRIASGSLQGIVTLDGKRVSPSLIKRWSAYVMQDDQLFPMLTVWETLRFAADMRLPESMSKEEKDDRVEKLIVQLGLTSARNTFIGDEAHRGVSGGERRRVSIGVDIVHGPNLLFLDEPTSGLDSTSAYSVIERVHDIAKAGSSVVLTIHQPSSRIQHLLHHLIILARGKLIYQGTPQGLNGHVTGLGRQVPKGENPIEYLLDIIQEFDHATTGVDPLVEYYLTGIRPDVLDCGLTPKIHLASTGVTPQQHGTWKPIKSPFQINSSICSTPAIHRHDPEAPEVPMTPSQYFEEDEDDFDHSLVKQSFTSTVAASPWIGVGTAASFYKGMIETAFTPKHIGLRTPSRPGPGPGRTPMWPSFETSRFARTPRPGPAYTAATVPGKRSVPEIIPATPIPDRKLYHEEDFDTDTNRSGLVDIPGRKFSNSWSNEVLILMGRNFRLIKRTPELFLSRQIVLTVMGVMMATMFLNPGDSLQGVTKLMSFFIFTVCLFFFSSNDAVPAFIMERFIFIRETAHNAYRCSSYVMAGVITYLPFLAFQALSYTLITWWALDLKGGFRGFYYFWLILYASLISTNSLVVFVSALVPNYILGYSAVIAFTAIFFLTCGYFVKRSLIPWGWIWMHYISVIKYPYEGLLHNQFETAACYNSINGTCYLPNQEVLKGLDINKPRNKWDCLAMLLVWAVFYRFLFYLVLRFASKNQRT